LTHLKKEGKIIYCQNEFEQNEFNLNKAWKLINKVLNKTKQFNNISMLQPEDSTQPADQHFIPNMLHKYFTS